MIILDEQGNSVGKAKLEDMVKMLQEPGAVSLFIPNMLPSQRFLLNEYVKDLLGTNQRYLLVYTPHEGEG